MDTTHVRVSAHLADGTDISHSMFHRNGSVDDWCAVVTVASEPGREVDVYIDDAKTARRLAEAAAAAADALEEVAADAA